MTTPRVTVPVEDLAGKLKSIRDKFLMPTPDKDFTDYAVMTRCIDALSAAPAPEGGAVWNPHQITPNDIAAILDESAECYDHGGGLCNASQLAEKIWRAGLSALATREEAPDWTARTEAAWAENNREEAPAEAGEDDLADRLRRAETWDLDADQEARDRCGALMLEAAERLEALRAQPQARSGEGE